MVSYIEHALETGSPPDVVAKVVLKAVTSENPTLRYLAGKDVEKWMEATRGMSDEEFHKMVKQRRRLIVFHYQFPKIFLPYLSYQLDPIP